MINSKPYRGGTEVFVYTMAHHNIFAATVAFLDNKKLSIHDAKIITSKSGFTVNTFVILDQRGKAIDDKYRAEDISQSLTIALNKPSYDDIRIEATSKRLKPFTIPTKINFLTSNNKRGSVLEIIAIDRPGLLAKISRVFKNCQINIHTAKITTFGEKAEDVFTISNQKNQSLTTEQENQLIAKLYNELT